LPADSLALLSELLALTSLLSEALLGQLKEPLV
jgi:hypothetical protein